MRALYTCQLDVIRLLKTFSNISGNVVVSYDFNFHFPGD